MPKRAPAIPWWAFVAAAALALAPAAAILPKMSGDAVYLADPMIDHSKIALIDAMARQGLPPVDPAFGAAGPHAELFYYYLWHFSAAALALPLHVSGWEADIAPDLVHRFCVVKPADGRCGVAQQTIDGRDLGCGLCRSGVAAHGAELDFRHIRARAVPGAADRVRRLAVSSRMGAAASDVGVMRGGGDAAGCPLRAAAKRAVAVGTGPGRGRGLRKLDLCGRHHLCGRGTGLLRRC